MQPPDHKTLRFVRALLTNGEARPDQTGTFCVVTAEKIVRLDAGIVRELIGSGVIDGDHARCSASPQTRQWLKRQMIEADAFAAQHRDEIRTAEGYLLNLGESPLARLAAPGPGGSPPFLERHQVEAGERVRKLAERAQLQPRVTTSYSASHTAGGKGLSRAIEIGDLAAEARKSLAQIHKLLPRDCASVVIDVCGLLRGLQTVEQERGWPRRSAKLVLRIGLEQLAQHYGFASQTVGVPNRQPRQWMEEGARPDRFE